MLGNKNFVLEVFVTDRIFCSPKDKQNILSCFMAGILPACFFVDSPDGKQNIVSLLWADIHVCLFFVGSPKDKQNILSCFMAGILPACFFCRFT